MIRMIVKKVKTMAIRKNKKRFDPRYFMDEKTEQPINESRQIEKTIDDSGARDEYLRRKREEEERKEATRRSKEGPVDNNVVRHTTADHSVDHSLEEGDLSHLADPAVWEALGQGLAHLAKTWIPLIGTAGFAVVAKDAIEYLRGGSKPEDALQQAVQRAESGSKEELEENSAGWAGAAVDQLRGGASPQGSADEAAKRLYALVGDQKMHDALQTIKDNFPNLGDVKKLEPMADSEFADDKLRNAIKILSVLGKRVDEWCPDCEMQRKSSKMPKDPTDVAEPGQLQERRRRLRKKRSK
jgi:hypothetical protein